MKIYGMYRERKYSACKAKQTKPTTSTKNETTNSSFCVSKNNEKFSYSVRHRLPKTFGFPPSYFNFISLLAKLGVITTATGIVEFKSSMGSSRFFSLKLPCFWWYGYISASLPSVWFIFCFLCSLFPLSVLILVGQSFMFSLFLGDLIQIFSCSLCADDSQCTSASSTTGPESSSLLATLPLLHKYFMFKTEHPRLKYSLSPTVVASPQDDSQDPFPLNFYALVYFPHQIGLTCVTERKL